MRVKHTLLSGDRNTTTYNSILNRVYTKLAFNNLQRIYRLGDIRQLCILGDDL